MCDNCEHCNCECDECEPMTDEEIAEEKERTKNMTTRELVIEALVGLPENIAKAMLEKFDSCTKEEQENFR